MTRKICVVTGSRAEFGLLRLTMQRIAQDPDLTLQVIATGMHLSPEFGSTHQEIEQSGIRIDKRVDMLLSADSAVGIAKSTGLGVIGFADALNELRPDLVLVLGDRFEILSAVISALLARIPVGHIHGGEVTAGAIDDAIRHAITKMSHLHFVSTKEYQQRVIQMGESPGQVHCVGGLGVDSIAQTSLLDRAELERSLGIQLRQRNLLVTFHPATLENESPGKQMAELLSALGGFNEIGLIFTFPNADLGGRELVGQIERFTATYPNASAFASLGQLRYLSCMKHFDGIVGNSSSGVLEAPSLHKGTVNIGDRQRGRIQAASIINCLPRQIDIRNAIHKLLSPQFQATLEGTVSPYGAGGASVRIVDIIKGLKFDDLLQKPFYDLPAAACLVSGASR